MYDMHDPNGSPVEWSYDRSLECKNEGASSTIGCLKVSISDVRASDVVPSVDDQAKGWRPWLDDDELLSVACSSLFFCPQNSFASFYLSVFYLQSLSADYFCFQIALRATLCPHFLIIFYHRDSDTKIYGEQGKSHALF